MADSSSSAPVELRDYLTVLRRRRVMIVILTALVVIGAVAWSLTRDRVYEAQGELVVSAGNSGDVPTLMATQSRILESRAVHQLATKKLPGAANVNARQDGSSTGMLVTAESTDAALAAATVNRHIDAYVSYVQARATAQYSSVASKVQPQIDGLQHSIDDIDAQLRQLAAVLPGPTTAVEQNRLASQRADLSNQVLSLQNRLHDLAVDTATEGDIDIVGRASPPADPISPDPVRDGLIALGAGLLLAIAAAFVFEYFDDSIRTRQDLLSAADNDVPLLGVIPAGRSSRSAVVALEAPHSPAAEAYRSLRTAVFYAGAQRQRVQVTSPRARQGKTETVVNLAVLAASAGQRVVVVDCDLRNPRVHEFFDLPNDVGFTSVAYGEPLSKALQPVAGVDRLYVVPSGPIPPNPSELLASERCHDMLELLRVDDTLVLVDTPPLLVVTDGAMVAPSVDSVLLVAPARTSTRKHVRQALDVLRQVGTPPVGVVLHQADIAELEGFGVEQGRRDRRSARRRQRSFRFDPAHETPAGSMRIYE